MELLDFITANSPAFLFVLARTGSLLAAAPVFGAGAVPVTLKMALAILISLVVLPLTAPAPVPVGALHLALGIAGEIIIGAAIGLAMRFIFAGIEFGARMASFQMGLEVASVYDPAASGDSNVLGRLMSILLLLLFLGVDGHLMVLLALKRCFEVIPPYGVGFSGEFFENMVILSKQVFILAVKFSAPVVALMVFANVVMGLIGRAAPQANAFALGASVTIIAGFIILALSMSAFEDAAMGAFDTMWDGVAVLIGGMGHA